ncbi:MAG: DUF5522 domain-containing protein [Bacteroidota bacterium]
MSKPFQNIKLEQGIHFYIENGLYVFTEKYHLARGYCCKSGCRHCPYGFSGADKNNAEKKGHN